MDARVQGVSGSNPGSPSYLDMYLPLSKFESVHCSTNLFNSVQLFSDISFGMCLDLVSWVQQVHNAAAIVASL